MHSIQYTVRGIPSSLDKALRGEARKTGKTLNSLVVETLQQAKLPASTMRYEDLDWFIGKTRDDAREPDTAQTWLDSLPAELT